MVADGTSSTDEGGDFVSQTEVETDNEATQLADRHFELLAMVQQQQGTTAKSTHRGGDCPIQADFVGNPEAVTTAQVAAREEAAIGRHQRGTTSTDQNKQYDPGGTGAVYSCLPSGHAVYCMLCCACFSCFTFLAISLVIIPGTEGSTNYPLKMRAIGTRKPEELFKLAMDDLGPCLKWILMYRDFLLYVGP